MTTPVDIADALSNAPNVTIEPSKPDPAGADIALAATHELIEYLEAQILPRGPLENQHWFGWIPLRLAVFFDGMHTCRQHLGIGRYRFLEIGSGIGSKLCLAHALGFEATGIERHQPYLNTCHSVFPHVTAIHANAETYDAYGQYDIVYSCRVASDRDRQHHINQRTTNLMRPGSLFFCPLATGPYPDWLDHLTGHVWRKP